jgi:small subunit ribosomal protein S7
VIVLSEETILQTNNILLFGKYGLSEVVVKDGGLSKYINLNPVLVPHSNAKHANRWFGKSKVNIVERLINNMMRTEVFTGKKLKAYRTVKDAFEIIAERTKKNPVQVLVEALENAAPREEITRLQFGGISVPKAVDIAPSRRLDIALRNVARGAVQSSFKSTKPIAECLASEIILASKNDMNSFSVAKKEEVERVAQSAR